MKTYYWLAVHDYFLGSTVSPGHRGRLLSSVSCCNRALAGQVSDLQTALTEYVFETVRLTRNPALPSRLEALALCASLEQVALLRAAEAPRRDHDLVYSVELVDEEPAVVTVSGSLARAEAGDTIATLTGKAHLYWSGYETRAMEILTLSPIRIRERLPMNLSTGPQSRLTPTINDYLPGRIPPGRGGVV